MSRYENALSTMQTRSILSAVRRLNVNFTDRVTIEENAVAVVDSLCEMFPAQFPVEGKKRMVACALSACALQGIRQGALSVGEYIAMLAEHKENSEISLYDLGAFGDLVEILTRCALMKVSNFITASVLYVKGYNTTDVNSRKFGKLEIGHNGKTLSFGTVFDAMEGDYQGIVYGMFSTEDKKEIYRLCKEEEYKKAVDYISEYMVLWENKYEFENDMNSLTRGKGIAIKQDGAQVVFNTGKYNAFQQAIEEGKFITLKEKLNR